MSTEDRHRAALKDLGVKRDKPRILNNHSMEHCAKVVPSKSWKRHRGRRKVFQAERTHKVSARKWKIPLCVQYTGTIVLIKLQGLEGQRRGCIQNP